MSRAFTALLRRDLRDDPVELVDLRADLNLQEAVLGFQGHLALESLEVDGPLGQLVSFFHVFVEQKLWRNPLIPNQRTLVNFRLSKVLISQPAQLGMISCIPVCGLDVQQAQVGRKAFCQPNVRPVIYA